MTEKTIPTHTRVDAADKQQEGTRAEDQFLSPLVDIYESDSGLILLADLPGVSREALDIQVKDDVLSIQARTHNTLPGELFYREFELANYFRQFQLSEEVDVPKISAELKHGVLKLLLPKAEKALPRKIAIKME